MHKELKFDCEQSFLGDNQRVHNVEKYIGFESIIYPQSQRYSYTGPWQWELASWIEIMGYAMVFTMVYST
jgi:hypothetical protein